MIYFTLFALLCLSVFNYSISRNVLYPPFMFSATWLLSLLALVLSGDTFYPVAREALLVYMVGAMFFSIGGVCHLLLKGNDIKKWLFSNTRLARVHKILDIGLLFTIIGLPFYIMRISEYADFTEYTVLAMLRSASVESSASIQRSFSIINNLVVLSMFIAMAMHYENDGTAGRKWRSNVAIIVAIVYGVLTGSKGWVLIFPTLAFLSFIRKKRVDMLTLGGVVSLILVFFGAGLLMVNYVYIDAWDPAQMVRILGGTVHNYWLGGLVAFNRIVDAPQTIASVQSLNRFFLETANGLGASFDIPSFHAEFTNISSSGDDTNTYTIYFSYFKDYGWPGVVVGMSFLGAGLSCIYVYAMRHYPIAVFVFATATMGIILSFHGEHFILALNYYLKLIIFYTFVYYIFTRQYSWKTRSNR